MPGERDKNDNDNGRYSDYENFNGKAIKKAQGYGSSSRNNSHPFMLLCQLFVVLAVKRKHITGDAGEDRAAHSQKKHNRHRRLQRGESVFDGEELEETCQQKNSDGKMNQYRVKAPDECA